MAVAAFIRGLLCLIVIAAVTDALSSHPYYKDYLRKRADERVERINNLPTLLSKLSADDSSYDSNYDDDDDADSESNVMHIQEKPGNVKDIVTDVLNDFFRSTGGDYWYRSDYWTLGDPCTWYGIKCSVNGTAKEIVEIDLHANNLTNGITAGIMHLSMYSPTTPPSGLSGALLGELTQNFCPTMGHLTQV